MQRDIKAARRDLLKAMAAWTRRSTLAGCFSDLTPNDAYFVRWHYAGLSTSIDLRTFRLSVGGAVTRPLQL